MPSHCVSSCTKCVSNIWLILLKVSSSCVTSCTCCPIAFAIELHLLPGVHAASMVLHLSCFLCLFCTPCWLAAMYDKCVFLPDIALAVLLTTPASSISIACSLGGFPIIPPIGRLVFLSMMSRICLTSRCGAHLHV
jgi:hypothetical protein